MSHQREESMPSPSGSGSDNTIQYSGKPADVSDDTQLFHDIVTNMQTGLYVYHLDDPDDDRSLRLMAANPASTTALGLKEEDVIGRYIDEVFPGLRAQDIPRKFADVIHTGKPFNIDDFPYGDTRVRASYFSFKAFPLPNNRVGILFEDTTLRKSAELALRESEERFQSVFNQAAVGIAVASPEGRWMQVNPMICSITGFSADELIGHSFLEITHPDDIAADLKYADDLLSGRRGSEYLQKRYITRDGGISWVSIYMTMVRDPASKPQYMVAIIEDITNLKRAEEEKRQFYRETISSVTDGKLQIVRHRETAECEKSAELHMLVQSYDDVPVARRYMETYCERKGLSGDGLALFMTGLGEALTNVVKHAGRGSAFAGVKGDTVYVGACDEGPGMTALALPKTMLRRGYSTKVSMGMGYSIMLDVSDRIALSTGADGTAVVLFKEITRPQRTPSLDDFPDTWDSIPDVIPGQAPDTGGTPG